MPITVQCTHCGAQLKLKDRSNVGRKVGCPKCRQPFVIQAPAAEEEFDFPEIDELGGEYGAPLPPRRAPERRRAGSGKNRKSTKSSGASGTRVILIGAGVAAVTVLVLVVGVGLWIYRSISDGVAQLEQVVVDSEQLIDATVQEQLRNASASASTEFASPQEAFDGMKAGINSRDWARASACMTDESQEMMAGGLLMMGGLVAAFGGEETAELTAVMEKHGLDMQQGAGPGSNDGELPIRDKPAFIADMLAAMESTGGGFDEGPAAWTDTSTLADLEVNGDAAMATVVTMTEEGEERDPIEFRRSNGTWLVQLPEELFQMAGGPSEFEFSSGDFNSNSGEVMPTEEPGQPLPEQTLENGLTNRLTVYRERPFKFPSLGQNFPDGSLYAAIELTGPPILACYEYGHFQVTVARDEEDRNLEMIGEVKDKFGEEFATEFIELNSFFLDEKDTLRIHFVLQPGADGTDSLARLEATLKLKVRQIVVVENILSHVGNELEIAELGSVGTFKVLAPDPDEAQPGQGLVVEYTGPDGGVEDVSLLDSSGEAIDASRSSFSSGRESRFVLDAGENLAPDTQLSISLGGNEKILVVPLEFENVPIRDDNS